MKFKKGVELGLEIYLPSAIIQPETISAMCIVYAYLKDKLPYVPTVTSVMDGKHMEGSLHYEGRGFDVRSWKDSTGKQLSQDEKNDMAYDMAVLLGEDYDVVVEATHWHIENDKDE